MINNKMPSSVIAHIKYNAAAAILRVIFLSGAVYDYLQVPENIYQEMKIAKSKGDFLNRQIKGNYNFRKVR